MTTLETRAKEIILEILGKHRGVNARIRRPNLLGGLNSKLRVAMGHGHYVSDRRMRLFIADLRKTTTAGAMICSAQIEGRGGYYLALDLVELREFIDREDNRGNTILKDNGLQWKHGQQRTKGEQVKLI